MNAMRGPLGFWIGPSSRRAPALEPLDVGLEMGRVEPEVLEAVVGAGVAGAQLLTRARAGDIDAIPPSSLWQRTKRSPKTRVSSLMILKLKGPHVPVGVFRGSGTSVDVVDAERIDRLLSLTAMRLQVITPRTSDIHRNGL